MKLKLQIKDYFKNIEKNRIFVAYIFADVAELADALDLGSSEETRGSSTLPARTFISWNDNLKKYYLIFNLR